VIVVKCQVNNFSAISWQGQVTLRLDDDDGHNLYKIFTF